MGYERTQHGPLWFLLYTMGAAVFISELSLNDVAEIRLVWQGLAVLMVFFAESFRHLTIRDEGDRLAIRYGPLPLLRKRIRYSDLTAVEPGRTTLADGWGIHWTPGRGWTYNLWGYDCVKLTLGRKVIRVGTDDVDRLVDFLRAKIGRPA